MHLALSYCCWGSNIISTISFRPRSPNSSSCSWLSVWRWSVPHISRHCCNCCGSIESGNDRFICFLKLLGGRRCCLQAEHNAQLQPTIAWDHDWYPHWVGCQHCYLHRALRCPLISPQFFSGQIFLAPSQKENVMVQPLSSRTSPGTCHTATRWIQSLCGVDAGMEQEWSRRFEMIWDDLRWLEMIGDNLRCTNLTNIILVCAHNRWGFLGVLKDKQLMVTDIVSKSAAPHQRLPIPLQGLVEDPSYLRNSQGTQWADDEAPILYHMDKFWG